MLSSQNNNSMVYFCLASGFGHREETGHSILDKCLEEGGDTRLKLDKLFHADILTGIVLGLLIGVYFPLDGHKEILGILSVVGVVLVMKVIGLVK